MKKFTFLIVVFCVFLFQGAHCLQLLNIYVPSFAVIDGKNSEAIVLDCEYELDDGNTFLVVKWLKDNEVLYQWIRGQKPSIFPNFKDKVEKGLTISSDPNQQYRRLALINPTIDTTGTYKCIVQTARETYAREKFLQIVDIKNYTMNVHHHRTHNETHLECTVENVYPEPLVVLTTGNNDSIHIISSKVNKNEDGFFNATIVALLNYEDNEKAEYQCTATFMGLNINVTTTVSSGCSTNTLCKSILLSASAMLLFAIKKTKHGYDS